MSLKHIPAQFGIDSEEDLRFAVSQFFAELGFDRDEMSFEDHFRIRLGHTEVIVNKDFSKKDVSGRSDILLTRNGRPLAIVETKSVEHDLTEEDAWQAISYARLLLEIAPYSIVTNGRETKVYDSLAPSLRAIESPGESVWATNGQQYISIEQDLRHETERRLVGVNPGTLHRFCESQVANALLDLKGNINQQKKYIPDLYVSRENFDQDFGKWLGGDMPYFALVGESGFGKTNVMCATAEKTLSHAYVLFYSPTRLAGGILDAIRNDFIWEFYRDKNIVYILDRFEHLCDSNNTTLVIFVDGLDEYNGDLKILKAELIDIAHRIRHRGSIRLCISCKLFDWPQLIIDDGQSYNNLARSIYPTKSDVQQPNAIVPPRAEWVGFQLADFSDDELAQAVELYKTQYAVRGEFKGDLLKECHNPLMPRFVAEVYGGNSIELPTEITSRELFDLYWERRLSQVRQRNIAERLLIVLSEIAFRLGERHILLDSLISAFQWNNAYEEALNDLFRLGILTANLDANNYKWVDFYFGKLLLYTFTMKAERWPLLAASEAWQKISNLAQFRLGLETIEFYISTIDRGETAILTELAANDLRLFIRVVTELQIDCTLTSTLPQNRVSEAIQNRMVQYAECYSLLLENYFAPQAKRVEPYSDSKVGLWTNGDMYQMRARTDKYPQPLIFVTNEIAGLLFNGSAPAEVYRDIRPHGTLTLGLSNFNHDAPQKMAWEALSEQIADLFCKRMLNEAGSPYILEERIRDVLTGSPSIWLENTPIGKRYLSLLGFDESAIAQEIEIDALISQTDSLLNEFSSKIPPDKTIHQLDDTQRWYYINIDDLICLKYWLLKLSQHKRGLSPQEVSIEDMFGYLSGHDPQAHRTIFNRLLPHILESYKLMFRDNFPDLINHSEFFESIDHLVLVELAKDSYSDFLTASYVVCPSINLSEGTSVIVSTSQYSIGKMEVRNDMLWGQSRSVGGRYGYNAIETAISGSVVHEPRAIINRTRYPSRTPVADQVYQLIGNEFEILFGRTGRSWSSLAHGSIDRKSMMHWVLSELRAMGS